MKLFRCIIGLTLAFTAQLPAQPDGTPDFRVARQGDNLDLWSPFFVYHLSVGDGLRAESWENRQTGQKLPLGNGPEVMVEIGLPPNAPATVQWRPLLTRVTLARPGEVIVKLAAENPRLSATVRYVWDTREPVLRRFVTIHNDGEAELDRLLNCRLGEYTVAGETKTTPAFSRGFPAYVADAYFLSLAHPAGFADVQSNRVTLRQYPGVKLASKQSFQCMEAIYGVSPAGEARPTFVRYVRTRMRRVRRGHDKPYAILESFGGQPGGDFFTTEAYLLEHLAKVAQGLREGAPAFDFYCTEFWHDPAGDLTTFNPKGFPNGYGRVRDEILKLGMRPGLWIDSGGLPGWTIGQNPAVRDCFTKGPGKGELCRASEPINTMYKQAFIRLAREEKVGLFKFDNVGPDCKAPSCDNTSHGHLPGPLYSVEAIYNALIDFYHELDAACPDVFVILYWGYRSPWWLEYGDTYFENGAHIEAASPADSPAPNARDSVTQRLDQAQRLIVDTPWLGKDSLGVWLSDWPWNSGVGKARWQEGLIMDICRGSLLAQVWTDTDWLTPGERKQLADFVGLLKAQPDCFANSCFILGSPWNNEPYGYACGNGRRSFLAIHNACLEDKVVTLPLGPACGLADKGPWDIYRWYPEPAKLLRDDPSQEGHMRMALRPYQVALLEVVPAGEPPSLSRRFSEAAIPLGFSEPSEQLNLKTVRKTGAAAEPSQWRTLRPTSATANTAKLTIRQDDSIIAGGDNVDGDLYTVTTRTDMRGIGAIMLEALTDDSLPAHGPGRAVNGNFALVQFRLLAAAADKADEPSEIAITTARADFSQTSHGGWPIAAAVDNDPATGWSVHPWVGSGHAAVFELKTPVNMAERSILIFKLLQGSRGHALGRFRLSVSAEKPPLLPAAYVPAELEAQSQLPANRVRRILLLVGDTGLETPKVTVAGKDTPLVPVWSDKSWWPCPWKAWRAELEPADAVRALRLSVVARQAVPPPSLKAYWLGE